ncbi:hypothetical protein LINGRAHAP2_LOCUS11283, partial [Linum grandiflorum]
NRPPYPDFSVSRTRFNSSSLEFGLDKSVQSASNRLVATPNLQITGESYRHHDARGGWKRSPQSSSA